MTRDELLQLARKVMQVKRWAPSTLADKFGSPGIMFTIEKGKRGPGLETAARFEKWLLSQLEREGEGAA